MNLRSLGMGLVAASLATTAVAETTVNVLSINRDSTPWRTLYDDVVAEYNANNPGVTVTVEYMEDESFKQKLPTLLQSASAPDMFFSWSGGVFYEQAQQGFLKHLPDDVVSAWQQELSPGGMAALSYKDKFYGAPEASQNVAIWYNKDHAAALGVDPTSIETWDDLLAMVQVAKDGGVTPFVVGGQDKWPLHFFYSFLAMRIMGQDGMAASAAGENGGFDNADWVRAGQEYLRLIELEPFQNGFMGVKYDQATGLWGDGESLFHLMGDWDLGASRGAASDGGLSNDQLGVIPFPMVTGGKGAVTDTLGGASGFVLTSKAGPEAIDFLKTFMGVEAQQRAAREGVYIPTVPSAGGLVEDPILKQFAAIGGASTYHQLFLDQFFGSSLGGAINDVSAQMATGDITAEEAAALLEETRAFQ
ncbi:Maltose/maltodextrin ABC transporter, substrate binding periplasmic protein MalE [Candidatus Rhodobacter oscarellae]|uniref:Maltose/maltodextrin ABC transporter, substrate binding periplasmic protein MalE n=1 Tax=Candidatus Rhodobacter oscarellae TaxID=1675527 RepID=A0A0J9E3Q0_9RHOB|nr:extracellular solute-binding protein [Candidatus Rhodobacter lobularis]KMW57426.1 Maltose/maltodextrin ABC transporter, substrate binding periplasmic protein MalE [Candidatus Rhodobacter lobularis]